MQSNEIQRLVFSWWLDSASNKLEILLLIDKIKLNIVLVGINR